MTSTTLDQTPNIDRVLGPILVGCILNAMLYGICIVQYWTYCISKTEASRLISALVNWVFFLDTFHTSSQVYMLWHYTIDDFNDVSSLTSVAWPFAATPIITTLTSFPIQLYLSWRIRLFSDSMKVFVFLGTLAVIQLALGFVCSVAAFMSANIVQFRKLIPYVDTWQTMAVACDSSITLLLWWYLNKSRTGSQKTDNIITRIIKLSVEIAAFGAFFCIMDLVAFTALPNNNFHVIFALPLGRIYTNTLLMTLNSRQLFRQEIEQQQMPSIRIESTQALNTVSLSDTMQSNIPSITSQSSQAIVAGNGHDPIMPDREK